MTLLLSAVFLGLLPLSFWMRNRVLSSVEDDERARYEAEPNRQLFVYLILGLGLAALFVLPKPGAYVAVAVFSGLWVVAGAAWEIVSLQRRQYSRELRMGLLKAQVLATVAVGSQSANVVLLACR